MNLTKLSRLAHKASEINNRDRKLTAQAKVLSERLVLALRSGRFATARGLLHGMSALPRTQAAKAAGSELLHLLP